MYESEDSDGIHEMPSAVGAECETNLEDEVLCQDVQEGTYDVGVELDLAKVGFDVIGMDHDVGVRVCDVYVIRQDEYVLSYCAELTLELRTVRRRCHGVDGYGVPMVSP